MSAPAARFLDFRGASAKLAEVGFTRKDGTPVPPRTIETWARRGRLPFFKGPNGCLRISEEALLATLNKMQAEAITPPPARAGRRAR